ncbi:MAG: hypothetical protein D6737_02880 [Chloroflexi bacterium]|nr:MAG: hypothetical protein D6737_02880 [Chloroflexota bacterium]
MYPDIAGAKAMQDDMLRRAEQHRLAMLAKRSQQTASRRSMLRMKIALLFRWMCAFFDDDSNIRQTQSTMGFDSPEYVP